MSDYQQAHSLLLGVGGLTPQPPSSPKSIQKFDSWSSCASSGQEQAKPDSRDQVASLGAEVMYIMLMAWWQYSLGNWFSRLSRPRALASAASPPLHSRDDLLPR